MERSRPKAIVLAAIVFALACESSINSPLDERGASPRRPAVVSNHITLVTGQTSLLAGDVASLTIEWKSRNPLVATVSSGGLVSAISAGTTYVTARYGTAIDTTEIVVRGNAAVLVQLDAPAALTIGVGEAYPMNAVTTDAAGVAVSDEVVAWKSDNPNIAEVSTTGVVTGLDSGTATITASIEGQTDSRTVIVVPPRAPKGRLLPSQWDRGRSTVERGERVRALRLRSRSWKRFRRRRSLVGRTERCSRGGTSSGRR